MQSEDAIGIAHGRGARPDTARAEGQGSREIAVIFTSAGPTAAALRYAGRVARGTGAKVKIVAPQTVPFPTQLSDPPVLREWNEARLRALAEESQTEISVHVFLCRDRLEVLAAALKPDSLIVIGTRRRRWWTTSEERLARNLRLSGLHVVLARE